MVIDSYNTILPIEWWYLISIICFLNITIGVFLTVLFYSCSNIIGRFYENESIINIAKLFSITFFINSLGLVGLALLEKELKSFYDTTE